MLCNIIYKIVNILSSMLSLTVAPELVSLPKNKKKTVADLSYVINACSIEDLNHHM